MRKQTNSEYLLKREKSYPTNISGQVQVQHENSVGTMEPVISDDGAVLLLKPLIRV
jgi:hypothetical protein